MKNNKKIVEQLSPGEQAGKLGLHHVGYGRYANNNDQVVAQSKDGKLVKINPNDQIITKNKNNNKKNDQKLDGPINKKDSATGNPKSEKDIVGILKMIVQRSKIAKEKGEKLPEYDLCEATIPGTNLFCGGNKEIPRKEMPQLIGNAVPGSFADSLPKNNKGEVDTTEAFKKQLAKNGIKINNKKIDVTKLKATQNQLVGDKVAGMVNALINEPAEKTAGIRAPIFVSNDGYILDGHHRWAALVGLDLANGGGPNVDMDIMEVDMKIEDLLDFSNKFCNKIGLQQKAASANTESTIKKEFKELIHKMILEILNEQNQIKNSRRNKWIN